MPRRADPDARGITFSALRDYRFYDDGAHPIASLIDVKRQALWHDVRWRCRQCLRPCAGLWHRFQDQPKRQREGAAQLRLFRRRRVPAANLVKVKGELYGVTASGGGYSSFDYAVGTVFSVSLIGTEQTLYTFGYKDPNGGDPIGGLIYVNALLYGTTSGGGPDYGGTAFSITTSGDLNPIFNFGSGSDGGGPKAAFFNVNGTLYGTTSAGGAYGKGTVFSA
jgi:hypothetical protein